MGSPTSRTKLLLSNFPESRPLYPNQGPFPQKILQFDNFCQNVQVLIQSYCLNMAMKSLMYYAVLIPDQTSSILGNVLNVFWRGLCVEDSLPGKFCHAPNPLTFTQATLVAPLAILSLLFLPTVIYVLGLRLCHAKKGMGVIDCVILFIFPIFTNLYYNFNSEVKEQTTPKVAALEWRARARSHSTPNISTLASEGPVRKRSGTSGNAQNKK